MRGIGSFGSGVILVAAAAAVTAFLRFEPGEAGRTAVRDPGVPSLRFDANLGQWDRETRFAADGPGYHLALLSDGAALSLREGARLRLRLAAARPSPRIQGVERLPGETHYYLGNDPGRWRTNVPGYAMVASRDVYPGVDVVFRGDAGAFRYDFIVAPGADPGVIALEFDGARRLRVDETGDLVLDTAAGEIRQRRPTIYQERPGGRAAVAGRYVLRGPNSAGFEIAAYDRAVALVIDPTLVYATYLGDVRADHGYDVAVDATGAAYIAGGRQQGDNEDLDVFVAKFDPTGKTLVWRANIGGIFYEEATGLALDRAGNVCITGYTSSSPSVPAGRPEYPRSPDALQPVYGGGPNDAFVTVLGPAGTLIYSTFFGGAGDDLGQDIALASNGDAYLTGATSSPDFPTRSAFQSLPGGGYDAYIARLSAGKGRLRFSSYLGGTANDRGVRIALDNKGYVALTGTTSSADFPTLHPLQSAFGGGASDAFLAQVAPENGRLVFSTLLGGTGEEQGRDVAIDAQGQVYLTGATTSPDFPTRNPLEAQLSAPAPGADAFLTKISPKRRALIYSTYLGAKGGAGVAVDSTGSAYVTGGEVQAAKLDPSGSTLLYAYWAIGGNAIALNRRGQAFVTGGTLSPLLPTRNAYQPRNAGTGKARGRDDAFLAKISGAPAPAPAFEETDSRISYSGSWSADDAAGHSGGRAVFSEERGAAATITFTGTGIQLIGRRDGASGFVDVMTDPFTPWGSAGFYASPAQDQAMILSLTGMPRATHTLTLTVSGFHGERSTGNRVWIDGFNVLDESP